MIEILSLPRRQHQNCIQSSQIKIISGLPINSLPGWEHIPLNSKLPMLKCPGNQVIFSKNKIGQSLRHLKHEFDPSGRDKIPEYNPLHDSNLKTFYANERNLKRLRENGEITEDNDVICNLKAFNEYRQQLHKSQLYYILKELNRFESEQHDRLLIANAEHITNRDHGNLAAREHTNSNILMRKSYVDHQKAERYKKLYDKTLAKLSYIEMLQTIKAAALEHRKILSQLKMQKHSDVRSDLQRKHLITLKKLFQFKQDRLHKNMVRLRERRFQEEQEKQTTSWNKRLGERIANQIKIKRLIEEVDKQKSVFIKNHKQKYNEQWIKIQQQIKRRAFTSGRKKYFILHPSKKTNKNMSTKSPTSEKRRSLGNEFYGSFDKLLDNEVCKALNTALDLENQVDVPFEPDDPIYKAAQYIMQHILVKSNKDLSTDQKAFSSVYKRIENFFEEAKKFVIFRSTQIITSFQNSLKHPLNGSGNSMGKVSFCTFDDTIGLSSYEINPLIELREVANRKPTPSGSLASLVVDSTTSLAQKTPSNKLCRNELVFIEHYVTKFKRGLIVGIGRRVFAAIQCHFDNKIMDVRQELLDIDRKFLVEQVTKSILSFSVNPLNFESNLRLCISALASDIIWSLQKQLLKPTGDYRRIAKPRIKCYCKRNTTKMCLYCHGEN